MTGLIDCDFVPYLVCYNKIGESEKTLEDCIKGADNYLLGLINGCNLSNFLLFFTVGKNFRYTIDTQYKANRVNSVKPSYFNEIKDYLISEYNGIYDTNWEADDLVSTYKRYYMDNIKPYIVISPDKDLMNLEGVNYNIKLNTINNINKEHEMLFFWKSVISGDTADGIKGLPGKGKVYADKIINNSKIEDYASNVLKEYIKQFGEEIGINEFYKNYKLLKIKDSIENIEFVEPVNVSKVYAKTLNVARE